MLRKRKKKIKQTRGGELVWKPQRLLHKLYLMRYCDSATSLSHLLEKEVNGWVKNLRVIQPYWSWHFSPLQDVFISCAPFHHTLEYVVIVIQVWGPLMLFRTHPPQNLLAPNSILMLVKPAPKQDRQEKKPHLLGRTLHLWPKSQVGTQWVQKSNYIPLVNLRSCSPRWRFYTAPSSGSPSVLPALTT